MRKISQSVKEQLEQEPNICARECDGNCAGRITWEHAFQNAGRQIDAAWAIIKLCEYHHSVNTYQDAGNLNKEKNQWIALNRATEEELKAYGFGPLAKNDYLALRNRLNKIYG